MLIPLDQLVQAYRLQIQGVLHVGAHTGEENDIYRKEGVEQSNIHWIEAIPEVAFALSKRLPNVIQAAVSDKVEDVVFKVTNNVQSSSILELKDHAYEHPEVHVVSRILLKTETLDSIVEEKKIRANFLNMDIQGAELKCLRGFERNIHMIDYVYTEVNTKELYRDCALLGQLDEWLDQHGFDRVEIYMTQHGWGDALYIRRQPYLHLHVEGRGGNQLFQIAATNILASKLNCDLRVNFEEYGWMFYDIFDYQVPYGDGVHPHEQLNCQVVTPDILNAMQEGLKHRGSYKFGGWFEDWSLLKDHTEYIKNLFRFKVQPSLIPETIVHIRLGDIPNYMTSIPEYASRVADKLTDDPNPVVILSDSLDHPYVLECLDTIRKRFPDRSVQLAEKRTDMEDFMRMVNCSHLVGTNSTFVFWAGLLGSLHLKEKKTTVFVSDKMFAPERTYHLYRKDPPSFCSVVEI